MFRLAHLSDPHIASPLRLDWRDFANKRLLGFVSWWVRRRHIHRLQVLNALARDVLEQSPDHVAVTGDITNIALPVEFPLAAQWLSQLGTPQRVSVIPGNHDAYVSVSWERSWAHWVAYMSSDAASESLNTDDNLVRFPFVRRREGVALVGLSTAIASGPGLALGRIGAEQLRRTRPLLHRLRDDGEFRIILLHHSPVALQGKRHKRLKDATAFNEMIDETGAELILHGHDHIHRVGSLPSRYGEVPVLGAASASALPVRGHAPAQYNLYTVRRSNQGWALDVRVRCLDEGGRFVEFAHRMLPISRQHAAHL